MTRKVSYKELLVNRDFRLLIFSQGVSNFGDWLIVGILVSLVTSPVISSIKPELAMAGLWISKLAPSLVFSPFIGALVDRLDRKKGMITSDIFRAAFVALVPLATVFGGLLMVYVVIFGIEVFTLFFVPAKDATIPDLVEKEQLIDANSLSFTINQVTMLLGLGIGATIIIIINNLLAFVPLLKGLAGTYTAVYVDSLTFIISAIAIGLIRFPKKEISAKAEEAYSSILEEVKDTFRFIAANPKIKSIIISAGFSLVGLGTILIVGPQYAQMSLNLGRDGFLILLTLLACGLVLGALASSWLSHVISKESLFSASLMMVGLSLVAFAAYAAIPLAIILSLISGFSLGVLYVSAYTIFHEHVGDVIRGRLFTALEADIRLALIASFLITSTAASLVGSQSFKLLGRTFVVNSSEIVMFSGGLIVFGASMYAFRVTRKITRESIIAKIRGEK